MLQNLKYFLILKEKFLTQPFEIDNPNPVPRSIGYLFQSENTALR